jgi:hypothetical protein
MINFKNINYKRIIQQILILVVVMTLAVVIDYIAHSTSDRFAVPPEYFRNKIIFGALNGFIAFWVLKLFFRSPNKLALGVSLVVAVVLQTKYFLLGYNRFFVFLFMMLHFFMFLVPVLVMFNWFKGIIAPEDDKAAMPVSGM